MVLDQTEIISLVGTAAAVSGIAFGYLGYQKGVRGESRREGSADGKLTIFVSHSMVRYKQASPES